MKSYRTMTRAQWSQQKRKPGIISADPRRLADGKLLVTVDPETHKGRWKRLDRAAAIKVARKVGDAE
jgi:hypothetical protein